MKINAVPALVIGIGLALILLDVYKRQNTVRVNIKRLRQKLNDDKQEYIVTVFGMGYTFGE